MGSMDKKLGNGTNTGDAVRHTTKLYRNVEQLMEDMTNVELEYMKKPTPRAKAQLMKVMDRFTILSEVIAGITK